MKLRRILSEEPNPQTDQNWLFQRLALISSDAMLENGLFKEHIPFLYAPTASPSLYVGDGTNKIRYHYEFRKIAPPDQAKTIEAAYTGDIPGAAGRIGFGLFKLPSRDRSVEYHPMPDLVLATFYKHSHPQMVNNCVKRLIERQIIDGKTLVSYQGTIHQAAELAAKGREVERPVQDTGPSRPTWQGEMEKTGTVKPGQKWWAPTSEGKGSRR